MTTWIRNNETRCLGLNIPTIDYLPNCYLIYLTLRSIIAMSISLPGHGLDVPQLQATYSCTMFSRNRVAVQVNHQKFQVLSRSGDCLGERSIMKPQHHGMSGWKPRMQRNWLWWGCFLWHSNGLNDETDPPSFAMLFFAFLPIARIKDEKIHQWKSDTEAWTLDQTGTTKMIKYKNILGQFDQTTPNTLNFHRATASYRLDA